MIRSICVTIFGMMGIGLVLFSVAFMAITHSSGQRVSVEGATMIFILAISLMLASIVIKNKEFWEILN